jgi:hypothetical protein
MIESALSKGTSSRSTEIMVCRDLGTSCPPFSTIIINEFSPCANKERLKVIIKQKIQTAIDLTRYIDNTSILD